MAIWFLCFWACGKAEHQGTECMVEKAAHFVEQREGERMESQYPLHEHIPSDVTFFH
jgi:hypothetical protein